MKKEVVTISILLVFSMVFFHGCASQVEFSRVDVTLNPHNISPLTAMAEIVTTQPVSVEVVINSKNNRPDLVYVASSLEDTSHAIIIKGLYEDTENVVELRGYQQGQLVVSKELIISTPNIEGVENLEIKEPFQGDVDEFILIKNTLYDTQGFVRWHVNLNMTVFPLANDLFAVVPRRSYYFDIIDYAGGNHGNFYVPNKYHHEIVEKTPGGNLVVATHHAFEEYGFDAMVELDRESGKEMSFWDLREYFDEHRPLFQLREKGDWAHQNSLYYDPTDNTFLVSLKLQNIVAKINHDDTTIKWMITPPTDWEERFDNVQLVPTNFDTSKHDHQDWVYLQHTATKLPNGNYMVYDNGAGRPGFTDTPDYHGKVLEGGYVRVVEYEVNEEQMTVEKVWEHTSFPHNGSNSRGSAYFHEGLVTVGYGEFGDVTIVRHRTDDVLFHGKNSQGGFYRAFPIMLP